MEQTDLIFKTAEGLLAVDQQQKIVVWNEGAERLFGFKAREVSGRHCYEVIGGRDGSGRVVCQASCRDAVAMPAQEPLQDHDLLVRAKGGQEIWVNVSTLSVPSQRGNGCALVHLFRDASRQKEMERFVEQLRSNVANLSWSLGAGAATTSPALLPVQAMTNREQEVLRLLASGASTQAIAGKLGISPATARNHINKILGKLRVHSRLEAVTLALRNGVI